MPTHKSHPLAKKRGARQTRLYQAALKPAARTLRSTGREPVRKCRFYAMGAFGSARRLSQKVHPPRPSSSRSESTARARLPMARVLTGYNVDQPRKNSSKRLERRSGGGMVRPVYRPPWSSSLMRALRSLLVCGSKAVARLGRPGALGHPSSKFPLRKQILQQAVIRPAHCLEELFSRGVTGAESAAASARAVTRGRP